MRLRTVTVASGVTAPTPLSAMGTSWRCTTAVLACTGAAPAGGGLAERARWPAPSIRTLATTSSASKAHSGRRRMEKMRFMAKTLRGPRWGRVERRARRPASRRRWR